MIALVVLAYLWPVLLGGDVLSPASVLYNFAPWGTRIPPDLFDFYNPLLSDVPMATHPWRHLARELIHEGTFPAWNPYAFGGIPLYSNPQVGLFTPFNLPLWVLPLDYALGLSAALKLWAGGFGTYLLVQQLRLGFLPGLLAGVAFAFSALNIVWLTHETLPAVAVMLPWAVLLIERIFSRGGLGNAIGLAVVVAVGLGGGHPGMQLHFLAFVAIYAGARALLGEREASSRERLRMLAITGGAVALGTMLMAVMLIPEALSSRGTLGTVARHGGRGTLPGQTMPFDAIKTVVFPDWWGRPSSFETQRVAASSVAAQVNFNERTFYAGVVALLLAAVGLVAGGGWRRKAPFLVVGFVGLAVPLHAPGLYWLATNLPFFEDVQSQRMHFGFAFAVAMLAAFGLRAVLDRPAEDRWRLAVPAVGIGIALIAFATVGLKPGDVGRTVRHFTTGMDFQRGGVMALTSIVWFLLFVVAVGAALWAARRWPRRATAVGVAVVALAVLDALHFVDGYQPIGPKERVFPPRTPAVEYLQVRADEGRFMGLNNNLTNAYSLEFGLRDARGYDPPYPTLRFYELWRMASPGQVDWRPFTIETITPVSLRVMSVLGARYVLADPGNDTRLPKKPVWEGFSPVYDRSDALIFRNERAVERAAVPETVLVARSPRAARAALVGPEFDPRTEAVVVAGEPGLHRLGGGADAAERPSVRVVSDENARVTLRASLPETELVVLNDQLTDGWSVEVDGEEAEIVRVNEVMRGVIAGPGQHEIVWSYAVPGLRAGALASLVALVGLCVGIVVQRRRQDREAAAAA